MSVTSQIIPRVLSIEQKPFVSSEASSDSNHHPISKCEVEPHWWYDNSRAITEFFHCLSSVFPEGEAFFVRSVSYYVKNEKYGHLLDSDLKRDASAFVTQEMHHSIEHRAYNKSIALKYDHNDTEKINADIKRFSSAMENAPLGIGHVLLLANTCSLEHITAMLGEMLLGTDEGRYVLEHMAPSHRSIWAWHAIEEMEHKSVAFDVYTKVAKGSYLLRVIVHVIGSFMFMCGTIFHVWKYLYQGGAFFSPKNHWDLLYFLFIFPGLLPRALPIWFEYFSPSFHPSQRDNSKLISEWSGKLKNGSYALIK